MNEQVLLWLAAFALCVGAVALLVQMVGIDHPKLMFSISGVAALVAAAIYCFVVTIADDEARAYRIMAAVSSGLALVDFCFLGFIVWMESRPPQESSIDD